jgi:hypothetical protein
MEAESILLSIAEISVAFAGFSGVVAVFGRRSSGKWRRGDILRFWQMIEVSLSMLIFALLPFIFHHTGMTAQRTWPACSAILALILSLQMCRALWRTISAKRTDPSISILFSLLFQGISLVVVILQIANVMGIMFHQELAPYLIGVFWLLCLACVLFWRLLKFSDLPGPSQ